MKVENLEVTMEMLTNIEFRKGYVLGAIHKYSEDGNLMALHFRITRAAQAQWEEQLANKLK